MASHRISVRIDENLHKQLGQKALSDGKPESELVREALEAYLIVDRRTCYEVAHKSGLIGKIKGGPRDLSTNRKHFDGFGRR